jgi:tetratricopeptide (TPR) repeat protein
VSREPAAQAASLAALEPGVLRVYFSELWGESDFWRGVLAGIRRRRPGDWADFPPGDPGARLVRAERLRKAGLLDEAGRAASAVLRLEPGSRHAFALRAKILLTAAAGSGHRALLRAARRVEADCRRAMSDESCLWAYNLLELALCAQGRHEEAYAVLAGLARLHPRRPELLAKLSMQEHGGDLASCSARLNRAIALRPGWIVLYAFRGELRRLTGRPNDALADFDFVVKERPDYDRAYLWRSKILRARGRLSEALADADRALAREPANARSHFERFQICLELGRLPAALASLERAERLESSYPWNAPRNEIVTGWRYRRFSLLCRMRRYEDALICLNAIRREDPKYTWSFGGRETTTREAERQLEEALRRSPANPWFRAWRGQTALAAGDADRALGELDRAVRLAPREAWFRRWRAEARLRAGRIGPCLADLKLAARARGCRAEVEGLRAEAALQEGRWSGALAHARRAARLEPTGAWALLSMARALSMLRRRREARGVLEDARRLAPGDPGVLRLAAELGEREDFFPLDLLARDAGGAGGSAGARTRLRALRARESAALKRELRRASKPELARIHARRGWAAHCLGEEAAAISDLNQAVALEPGSEAYRVRRGLVLEALARRDGQ